MSWKIIPVAIFVLLLFFLWRGLYRDPQQLPSSQIGHKLPDFSLTILGKNSTIKSKSLIGRPVLLNIWASWCQACIQEQLFLLQLAGQGIVIYGLNYKDTTANAQQWLATWGNPFKKILFDPTGKVAIDLGVYGTPETFLLDRQGVIRYRHVGILDVSQWQKKFLPLLNNFT